MSYNNFQMIVFQSSEAAYEYGLHMQPELK